MMKPETSAWSSGASRATVPCRAANDPPAVDVGHEHDRQAGRAGDAHVRDVGGPQVDLRRAAGALADHDVVVAAELGQAVHRHVEEPVGVVGVLGGIDLANGLAEHDDLAAVVTRA